MITQNQTMINNSSWDNRFIEKKKKPQKVMVAGMVAELLYKSWKQQKALEKCSILVFKDSALWGLCLSRKLPASINTQYTSEFWIKRNLWVLRFSNKFLAQTKTRVMNNGGYKLIGTKIGS